MFFIGIVWAEGMKKFLTVRFPSTDPPISRPLRRNVGAVGQEAVHYDHTRGGLLWRCPLRTCSHHHLDEVVGRYVGNPRRLVAFAHSASL